MKNKEIVATKNTIAVSSICRNPKNFILFEGIGQEIDPSNNYLFTIMKADENTYSKSAKSNEYFNNGEKIRFVNAYQGRNNRRITISGSINLCSNKFYHLSSVDNSGPLNSPNANFCQDILNWNFQRTGVLKYENIRHQRV
jgi:oligosaccharyltransferase complex subunit beta